MKNVITNLILLYAFSPVALASTVSLDDPKFVRLSDGREVELGVAGVLCDNECVEAAALTLMDAPPSRMWIPLLTTTAILCAVLCRPSPPVVLPNRPETPPRVVPDPPPVPVPEAATLAMVGFGLLALADKRRRDVTP